MSRSDETYIVRVRSDEGDAVVEDVRTQERSHARDLSELGGLITRLIERARARRVVREAENPPLNEGGSDDA